MIKWQLTNYNHNFWFRMKVDLNTTADTMLKEYWNLLFKIIWDQSTWDLKDCVKVLQYYTLHSKTILSLKDQINHF